MTHYGLFVGRDLLGYASEGGPRTLITGSTEAEVWQHLSDLVTAHLNDGADGNEMEPDLSQFDPDPAARIILTQQHPFGCRLSANLINPGA